MIPEILVCHDHEYRPLPRIEHDWCQGYALSLVRGPAQEVVKSLSLPYSHGVLHRLSQGQSSARQGMQVCT